ncbi:MAG: hypothetical protein K2J91_02930 [Lachnospiraceae bacterium]|nr:hypothetical protein [Lachnospiraceae bacterium]
MQVNVANSNIIGNENSINSQAVKKSTGFPAASECHNVENDIYQSGNSKNSKITYSKNDDEEKSGNKNDTQNDVSMLDLINNLKDMITPEGYDQLEELGIIMDDENPELSVSVYERIQMELATYCEDFVSTGLNIDPKKLEQILGSAVFANAVEKALSIKNMDKSKQALVVEDGEPARIDEVYEKAFSSGRRAENNKKEVSDELWQNLRSQIEKVFEKSGIELNEENQEIAKWMVSYDIPITKENISKAVNLANIMAMDISEYRDMVSDNILKAIYLTGDVKNASIDKNQYNLENVNEAIEVINNATDEDIASIIKEEKVLNIANLKAKSRHIHNGTEYIKENGNNKTDRSGSAGQTNTDRIYETDTDVRLSDGNDRENDDLYVTSQFISIKRVVVEARLVMTVPSLMRVQQLGLDINITELSTLLDYILDMEKKEAKGFLDSVGADSTTNNIDSFIETNNAVINIRRASVSFVAKVESTDTLSVINDKAVNETGNVTERATISGTSSSTTVYTKSSTSVSVAIESYETVETSIRRDLGDSYDKAFSNIEELLLSTGMENTEYNRRAVRILGYNAMAVTEENIVNVREMAAEIDYLVENLTPKTVAHLIANNINPMNKNIHELNEELVRLNEEIGAENENFAEFLWNLDKTNGITPEDREKYIAMYRSLKEITKKDIRAVGAAINSNYDFTISNLLAAAKSRKVSGDITKNQGTRIDIKDIEKSDNNIKSDSYAEYRLKQMEESTVTEEDVRELINNHVDVTPRNVKNAGKLKEGNKVFEELYSKSSSRLKALLNNLIEAEDEDSLRDSFEAVQKEAENAVKEEIHKERPLYENIETALENSGLVKLMNSYAKNESYYIPMEIEGKITNIHLTIKSGSRSSGVAVDIQESSLGSLHLEMVREEASLKGIIVYSEEENYSEVSELADNFRSALNDINISIDALNIINSKTYNSKLLSRESQKGDTGQLYSVAKLFITAVRTYEITKINR